MISSPKLALLCRCGNDQRISLHAVPRQLDSTRLSLQAGLHHVRLARKCLLSTCVSIPLKDRVHLRKLLLNSRKEEKSGKKGLIDAAEEDSPAHRPVFRVQRTVFVEEYRERPRVSPVLISFCEFRQMLSPSPFPASSLHLPPLSSATVTGPHYSHG